MHFDKLLRYHLVMVNNNCMFSSCLSWIWFYSVWLRRLMINSTIIATIQNNFFLYKLILLFLISINQNCWKIKMLNNTWLNTKLEFEEIRSDSDSYYILVRIKFIYNEEIRNLIWQKMKARLETSVFCCTLK